MTFVEPAFNAASAVFDNNIVFREAEVDNDDIFCECDYLLSLSR